jgi:hypothetical protein
VGISGTAIRKTRIRRAPAAIIGPDLRRENQKALLKKRRRCEMGKNRLPKYIRDLQKLEKEGKSYEEARFIVGRRTGYYITEEEYRERLGRGY